MTEHAWVPTVAETKDIIAAYEQIGEMFLAIGKALADLHIRAWAPVTERLGKETEQ